MPKPNPEQAMKNKYGSGWQYSLQDNLIMLDEYFALCTDFEGFCAYCGASNEYRIGQGRCNKCEWRDNEAFPRTA